MNKQLLTLLIGITILSTSVNAQNWYVDNTNPSCNNLGIGDFATPLCDITTANTRHIGGDTVYIMPGEYREEIIPKSGISNNQRTIYSGYGDRNQIKILGSDEVTGWTQYDINIWQASFNAPIQCFSAGNFQNTNCWSDRSKWFNRANDLGTTSRTETLADLDLPGEYFYDDTTQTLYLWPHNNDDPNTHLIECSQRALAALDQYGPNQVLQGYFTLKNVTMMMSADRGITLDEISHDVTIKNTEWAFNTGRGYCFANPSAIYHGGAGYVGYNLEIKDNIIRDQGSDRGAAWGNPSRFDGSSIELYAVTNSIVERNTIYNSRLGIYGKSYVRDVIFRNNTIFNQTEAGIQFFRNWFTIGVSGLIEKNIIYDITGPGIAALDEIHNLSVIGNTLINTNGLHDGYYECDSNSFASENMLFQNNIVYNSPGISQGYIRTLQSSHLELISDHNLLFNINPYGRVDLTGTNAACPTDGDTVYNSLTQWQTVQGKNGILMDANSIEADPLFIDSANADFSLQSTSPAIDAGTIIPGYHCTVSGVESEPGCKIWYGSAPDIGAIEYISAGSIPACENRYEITSTCSCDGINVNSGYCCYYDPDAGNITYQTTETCGYTKWSPHWEHIITSKEDYRYYDAATRSQELQWSAENHDFIITSDTMDEIKPLNPNVKFIDYDLDLSVLYDLYNTDEELIAYATANGYNIEDAYLHFSDDTTVNLVYRTSPDEQITITGCPATPVESCRALISIWNNKRWAVNVQSDLAKNYFAYRYTNMTTTISPGGNSIDGIFLDEHPPFPSGTTQIISGIGGILEYGGQTMSALRDYGSSYYDDLNAFMLAVNNGMPAEKLLIPNHAEYSPLPRAVEQSLASDGAFYEFMLDPNRDLPGLNTMFVSSDQLLAAGKLVIFTTRQKGNYPNVDYYPAGYTPGEYLSSGNRARLTELAMYYLGKDVNTRLAMFNILGAWGSSYDLSWTGAQEAEIGTPTSDRYIYETGIDPNGRDYTIWARNFTKGIVLFRPKHIWSYNTFDDTTQITTALPEPMTPIAEDGSSMPATNTFTLRNSEAAILLSTTAQITTCPLPYDTSPTCNNCIDAGELSSTITGWFNNQINIAQLVVNIKNWKSCN